MAVKWKVYFGKNKNKTKKPQQNPADASITSAAKEHFENHSIKSISHRAISFNENKMLVKF